MKTKRAPYYLNFPFSEVLSTLFKHLQQVELTNRRTNTFSLGNFFQKDFSVLLSNISKQMTSIFSNLLYCSKAIKYCKHLSFPTRRSFTQSFPTFILHFICIGWRPNSSLFNLALCWSWRLWPSTPRLFFHHYIYSSYQKRGAFFVFLC